VLYSHYHAIRGNMDEQESTAPIEESQKPKPTKKPIVKRILLSLLVLVLIAGAAGAAYWWRDKTANDSKNAQAASITALEKSKTDLEKQLADEKAKVPTTVTNNCACASPNATAVANIKASITSGNTAALEGYMASSVNVVLAASEGLGPKTPAQAVSAISNFISSDANSWDYNFSLPASILSSYGQGSYGQYFPNNAIVGKASNKKVISFSFDCNGKIDTVLLVANEALLE
jgi:hypothetical protein